MYKNNYLTKTIFLYKNILCTIIDLMIYQMHKSQNVQLNQQKKKGRHAPYNND